MKKARIGVLYTYVVVSERRERGWKKRKRRNRKKRSVNCEVLDEVYGIVREVEEERRKVRYILESDVQSRTMAGALSENAPRPVSVVAVGGATVDNARSNQLTRPQVCIVIFIFLFVTLLCVKLGMLFVDLSMIIFHFLLLLIY